MLCHSARGEGGSLTTLRASTVAGHPVLQGRGVESAENGSQSAPCFLGGGTGANLAGFLRAAFSLLLFRVQEEGALVWLGLDLCFPLGCLLPSSACGAFGSDSQPEAVCDQCEGRPLRAMSALWVPGILNIADERS